MTVLWWLALALAGSAWATAVLGAGLIDLHLRTGATLLGLAVAMLAASVAMFVAALTELASAKDGWRPALASWYGPGLYGNKLGCGGILHPGTEGVAHKDLACGTRLQIRYGGRTVTARVIDRGPYVGDREFDLAAGTRNRLGFTGTGTISVREIRYVIRARMHVTGGLELAATGGVLAPRADR